MSADAQRDPIFQGFSGRAPLFPLSNVVLFPHALLPLHIFEPRYRQMTADALAGESLIAMALLKSIPDTPPPIYDVVGLGRIVAHERLPDGRYHLVLRGVARARIQREIPTDKLYRIAELDLLKDAEGDSIVMQTMARRLVQKFEHLFPNVRSHPVWDAVAQQSVPLGVVCDLLASALPVAPAVAQQFLADLDVQSRSRALWAALDQIRARQASTESVEIQAGFPPEFSLN